MQCKFADMVKEMDSGEVRCSQARTRTKVSIKANAFTFLSLLLSSLMAAITDEYVQRLPSALLPISPSIAAIHAARARRRSHHLLHANTDFSDFATSFCATCGTYLLDGTGSIRIASNHSSRKNSKNEDINRASRRKRVSLSSSPSSEKVIRISCTACNGTNELRVVMKDAPAVQHESSSSLSSLSPMPRVREYPAHANTMTTATTSTGGGVQDIQVDGLPNSASTTTTTTTDALSLSAYRDSPSLPSSSSASASPSSSHPPPAKQNKKARPKHKAGLQELLARKKLSAAAAAAESQNKESSSSLASFLNELS
jgi:hypothetical protein